jgi:hypothetical protein
VVTFNVHKNGTIRVWRAGVVESDGGAPR